MKMQIEIFSEKHIPEAAEIEKICFSDPWSEDSLGYLCSSDTACGVAATEDGRLAAYGGLEHVLDTASIINIAVHPDFRRRGYGRAILSALESKACEFGAQIIFLDVRESNEPAKSLYLSSGYRIAGIRRGYYSHPRENAIVMAKDLSSGSE